MSNHKSFVWSIVLLGCASAAFSQTYDAYSAFVASIGSGSASSGPWTYGWTDGLNGAFNIFDTAFAYGPGLGWDSSTYNSGGAPLALVNTSGTVWSDGNVVLELDDIDLSGCGPTGFGYADIMWTAPRSGKYLVGGAFLGQQYGDDADYNVLVGGVDSISGSITNIATFDPFSGAYTLTSGETVVFAAGPNGDADLHDANIGLIATIQAVPEPAPVASFGIGTLGFLLCKRRKSRNRSLAK